MIDTNLMEDPATLIASLERFYQLTEQGITVQAYYAALGDLRVELQEIKDTSIRAEAVRLFHHVGGGAHVLSRDSSMTQSQVLPPIRALIDFLKKKLPPA